MSKERNIEFQIKPEDLQRITMEETEDKISYQHSIWKDIRNGFLENKIAIVCLIFLIVIIIAAICAPLSPHDPNAIDATAKFQGISSEHWLGTDEYGRDYFTRILYGAQVSIAVGVLAMAIAIFMGTLIGTIAGYVGGKADTVLMRLTEIFLAIPAYLVALVLRMLMEPTIFTLVIVLSIFAWPSVARITRAQTMTLKYQDFVVAAKNLGAGNLNVIFKHIIPNMINSIFVAAALSIANAILAEAFLSYLGLGVQLPRASWGSMLQSAQDYMLNDPLLAVVPGLLILLTVLSFNIIGGVLQKAFEPKMNK